MTVFRLQRGLDLPVAGVPAPGVHAGPRIDRVAILGADCPHASPHLQVATGDGVRRGQALFHDRKSPEVRFTAPVAGTVEAIHRGPRRRFVSVVLRVADEDVAVPVAAPPNDVRGRLLESGLWTALRTRPFGRIPDPAGPAPAAIFVTAMDSAPLAPPTDALIAGRLEDLERGLRALASLCDGPVHLCKPHLLHLPMEHVAGVQVHEFRGPHPSGTVGLHIHLIDPVGRDRIVWHMGVQDVLAVGRLMERGELDAERIVALGGPQVVRPRLLRTVLGASLDDLCRGELADGENRLLSGSVLHGRQVEGPVEGYLGRYHQQVSVLLEGRARKVLGWLMPGAAVHSALPAFLSGWLPRRPLAFSTTTHGQRRHMVPVGVYEAVFPFDIEATYLLRALLTGDSEQAEALGCLELDEEDLALATYVCPSKIDHGAALRGMLDRLAAEG